MVPVYGHPSLIAEQMTIAMIKNMPTSDPKYAPDLVPIITSAEIVDEY